MPRKNLIRTNLYPYHIYSRANNKAFFPLPIEEVWELFLARIRVIEQKFFVKVYCFVLMSNHYHILLQTPDANIDKVMHDFSHKLSLQMLTKTNSINRIFGGRYKWSLVRDERYFSQVYRYIIQNPLRASLVKRVESYPYSSLACKDEFDEIPRDWCSNIENTKIIEWLNDVEPKLCAIQKGLRKTIFKPVVDRKTKAANARMVNAH